MTTEWLDDVRWFDELGKCRECPKPATGKLMGSRNESYGAYCAKCANKRLTKARAARGESKPKIKVETSAVPSPRHAWDGSD